MDNQILWTNVDGNITYGFGGRTSASDLAGMFGTTEQAMPVALYQFDLISPLNGNWLTIDAPSYQSAGKWQALNRPDSALGATVGNTGFIVGGIEDAWSQPGLKNLNDFVLYVVSEIFSSFPTNSG